MPIYLIRNACTGIEKGTCYGQTDIDVSATFDDDLTAILPGITGLPIDKVYSSTLKRSYKMAENIAESLRTTLKKDARLNELNFGIWEMLKWEQLHPTELNIWMQDFVNIRTPHGESYLELYKRVNDFLNSNDLRDALIVAHAGSIRSILCSLTNTPLIDSFRKFDIKHNQLYEVDIVKRTFNVRDVKWEYKS
jgi:alpha-ribazole phosphatase